MYYYNLNIKFLETSKRDLLIYYIKVIKISLNINIIAVINITFTIQ